MKINISKIVSQDVKIHNYFYQKKKHKLIHTLFIEDSWDSQKSKEFRTLTDPENRSFVIVSVISLFDLAVHSNICF